MSVRYRLFFLLLSFLVFARLHAQTGSKPNAGYTIKGHIAGLEDGERVLMSLVTDYNFGFQNWDSTVVKNGEFFMKGSMLDGPRTFWLQIGEKKYRKIILLIDNNDNITINSDKNYLDIPHGYLEHWVDIQGNPTDRAGRYMATGYQIWSQSVDIIDNKVKQIVDSIGFDYAALDPLFTVRRNLTDNFYALLMQTPEPDYRAAVPMIANVTFEHAKRSALWSRVYDSLDDHLKNSWDATQLKEKLKLGLGQPFPLFTLPTVDGKLLALKDVIAKSKLTLVQFYAVNSVDVDRYQQELLAHYKKYHAKGLNIVGVSSDTSAKKWKIAAADLPWETASDLKGENGVVGSVYKEYGAHGTPQQNTTNVLIDQNGKIVAWDVNGAELQWYLRKTFGE